MVITYQHQLQQASIIAKVKDYLMVEYSKKYEGYGFEEHKGYPTKKHLKLIEEKA